MKTAIFDKKGKELKQIELPKNLFEVAWNGDLIHEVVVSMNSNSRKNTQKTKDRAEVSGGGKKPWRQKGLGRARHGSIRSPIWVGGGVSLGPRNDKNYTKKINKKIKAKALAIVLSRKAQDGEIILVDSLKLSTPKTMDAKNIIDAIAKNKDFKNLVVNGNNPVIIALSERDANTEKSFRNISNLQVDLAQNLNVVDLLNSKYLIVDNPEKTFEILEKRVAATKNTADSAKGSSENSVPAASATPTVTAAKKSAKVTKTTKKIASNKK